jgi:hypothetical protein
MAARAGRSRPRIAKSAAVELGHPDTSQLREEAVAENVSAGGIRVATEHVWGVGSIVLLTSPELGIHTEARVVYCQRVDKEKYAVGLELLSPEKEWTKPN